MTDRQTQRLIASHQNALAGYAKLNPTSEKDKSHLAKKIRERTAALTSLQQPVPAPGKGK